MSQQYTPTKEQQEMARMKSDYDRLDIKAREAKNRLNRNSSSSLPNRRNHSLRGTIGNAKIAKIDYNVTMNNIERERERLDIKYGNGKYAQLNLTDRERDRMASIQYKYDQLANREDQISAEGKKERTKGITNILDRRSKIGKTINQAANNGERRDIKLDEIQREREKLNILYGGEPKNNPQMYQSDNLTSENSLSATESRTHTSSITSDQREVREVNLENLNKVSNDMKQSAQMSGTERLNKFNGTEREVISNKQTLSTPIETQKIGLGI